MATFPNFSDEKSFALTLSESLHKALSDNVRVLPVVAEKINAYANPLASYRSDNPTETARKIVNFFAEEYLSSPLDTTAFVHRVALPYILNKIKHEVGPLTYKEGEDYKEKDTFLRMLLPDKSIPYNMPYRIYTYTVNEGKDKLGKDIIKTIRRFVWLREPGADDYSKFYSEFRGKDIKDYSFVSYPCGSNTGTRWLPKKSLSDDIYIFNAGSRLSCLYHMSINERKDCVFDKAFVKRACEVFTKRPALIEYRIWQIAVCKTPSLFGQYRMEINRWHRDLFGSDEGEV